MRLLPFVLLFVALAVAASAESYTDSKAMFRVTIPDGWEKSVRPEQGVTLLVISPRAKETIGFCFIASDALPGTETSTQEELDEALRDEFTKAAWEKSM